VKLGLHVARFTYPGGAPTLADDLRSIVTAGEAAGYDRISVMDHVWQIHVNGPPEQEMLEPYTALGYMAALTSRVQLLTLVTGVVYRPPGLLAKMVTTLDVLSGGRAMLGIGAAWNEEESLGLALPFPPISERFERLEETIQICLQMWSDSEQPYQGRRYQLARTLNSPQALRRPHPPILIGGGGERVLMGIVVKYAQIWNNLAASQHELGRKVAALRKRCDELGRDFDEIEVSQQCVVIIAADDAAARAALAKANRIYGGHMGAALEEHGIWGTPAQVVERIERHVKLGCTSFVIEFFGRDTREPARLFAEKVMPAFG
jgi:alkanesulfonate monooxygenase